MTYEEATNFITSANKKSSLENMRKLMSILKNPQRNLKIIHVAGTNGKGSTCAMLNSILKAAGYRVGLFTSPHLEDFTERMRINDICIPKHEFASLTEKLKCGIDILIEEGGSQPSFFEMMTAMAFCYFEKTDYVIIEVGIGGRLDSTNIIESPLLSVITSIGYDHMDFLGNTIEDIAKEKAGIIKKDCQIVLYFQQERVYNIIKQVSELNNCKLYYPKFQDIKITSQTNEQTVFDLKTDLFEYKNLALSLLGDFQIYNACNALMCIHALQQSGIKLNISDIYNGLASVEWHGRMEIIKSNNKTIVVDGAHNIDGMQALKHSMLTYFSNRKIILVIGILKDKKYKAMLLEISQIADKIVLTEPESPRAAKAEELLDVLGESKNIYVEKNISNALAFAQNICGDNEVICCTGSLYLVGSILQSFSFNLPRHEM